jgi:hypothetical protein
MENLIKNEIEFRIQEIVSSINFKKPNDIDFDSLTEAIKEVTGCIPSVRPTWIKYETANEDMLLDGSNKITEKITELNITYLIDGIPTKAKFIV